MKTVQGGLLVVVGLGVLWLAVTGRLDRLSEAWQHIKDNTKYTPAGGGGISNPGAPTKPSTIILSSFPGLPGTLGRAFQ